jgi:hypothetical protein
MLEKLVQEELAHVRKKHRQNSPSQKRGVQNEDMGLLLTVGQECQGEFIKHLGSCIV